MHCTQSLSEAIVVNILRHHLNNRSGFTLHSVIKTIWLRSRVRYPLTGSARRIVRVLCERGGWLPIIKMRSQMPGRIFSGRLGPYLSWITRTYHRTCSKMKVGSITTQDYKGYREYVDEKYFRRAAELPLSRCMRRTGATACFAFIMLILFVWGIPFGGPHSSMAVFGSHHRLFPKKVCCIYLPLPHSSHSTKTLE